MLLALLVGLRIAAPFVVGPFLEERLSRALGARVQVGDVSFAPIDAVVTLGNVRVDRPGAPASDGDELEPAIHAARVRLDLQWLPLLHRALVVREVALESARIEVERTADGGTSLDRLLNVDAAPELPPGWSFAIDRVMLRDSLVRVRDTGDDGAPLELGVRDAEFSTMRRRASAFKRAPNLHVDVLVEGGRIRIDGTTDVLDDGSLVVDALLRVKDVPLERLREYLPEPGGALVAGRLSGQLHYQREPGRRDTLSGRLRARRVTVHVPTFDAPALAIRRVEAELDKIDFRRQRVVLEALTLHGARLAVRPDLTAPVPLFDATAVQPAATDGKRRAASSAAASPRWTWSVARFAAPYARVEVVGAEPAIVLPASVVGENLGPAAYWSPLRAWLGRGDQIATFDGTARLTRGFTIDGRLTADGIDAALFARAFKLPFAELVQAGVASADLTVDVAPGATDGPPVAVRGKLAVDGLWLAAPDPGLFAIGASTLELQLDGVRPAAGPRGTVRPAALHFRRATVRRPYVLLTRAPDGWLVPPFAEDPALLWARLMPVRAESESAPETDAAVVPAAAAPAEPPAPSPAQTLDAATPIVLGELTTIGGRVIVLDFAHERRTALDVDLLEGWARDVRLPGLGASQLVVQGRDRRLGRMTVAASRSGGTSEIELSAQDVPLAALTPYLQQAELPYGFAGGTARFLARIWLRQDGWSADATVALQRPEIVGDEDALRRALGMPVRDAIATLRDSDGDITLRLTLGSRGDVPTMVASALRSAVTRARLAPLPDRPIEIRFAPGSDELGVRAKQELGEIAYLLASRSDAVVELSSTVSEHDRRFLAEQAAAQYLEEPEGFMGVLRVFGVRDQDTRIREALAERRAGRPGRLSPEDEAVLREIVAAAPPIDPHRLTALARARVAKVARELVDRHGVEPSRIMVNEVSPTAASAGPPTVRASVELDTTLEASATRAEVRRW